MRRLAIAGVAALLLAGCDQAPTGNMAAPSAPGATPSPAPLLSRAAAADLSRHAGTYPFDKVDGRSFLDEPAVRSALVASGAGAEASDFILTSQGPQVPIALRDGKLVASGCEAHNCDAHDWSVVIAPDGGSAEVCVHDADSGTPPRWFANGTPEAKRESCS